MATGQSSLNEPSWSFDVFEYWKMCRKAYVSLNYKKHLKKKMGYWSKFHIRDLTRFIGLVNWFNYIGS